MGFNLFPNEVIDSNITLEYESFTKLKGRAFA